MTASLSSQTSTLDPALAVVRDTIAAARSRALVLALCDAGLWGLSAGLAVLCSGRVLALFLSANFLGTSVVAAAVVVGLATAALTALFLHWRRPSAVALARRADRLFSTGESLSTALELASAGRPAGPFEGLVIARARASAGRVAPEVLIPFRVPRSALPALFLAFAAIALTHTGPAASTSVAGPDIGIDEQTELALTAEAVALRLSQDAKNREDPYIAAVANELRAVSRALSMGERSDRAALLSQLEQLRGHAVAGYAEAGMTGTSEDRSALFDPLIESVRSPAPDPFALSQPNTPLREETLAPSTEAPQAGDATQRPQQEAPHQIGAGPAAPSGQRDVGDTPGSMPMTDAPCLIDGEESCMAPRDTNYLSDRSPSATVDADTAQAAGATPTTGERPESGEGLLIGPANQSGQGDSTQAGRGSETLLGEDPQEALIALGEHLVLANQRRDESGAQTRLDRAPAQQDHEITELAPADISAWHRSPERPTAQNTLPPNRRDVLTRYFAVERE